MPRKSIAYSLAISGVVQGNAAKQKKRQAGLSLMERLMQELRAEGPDP
jgi:hypothetical protein